MKCVRAVHVRPPEVGAEISRAKLAGPLSGQVRSTNECAVTLLVSMGRTDLLVPRVHSRVIHRVLREKLRDMDSRTGTGWLLHIFLAHTPGAFREYCRRRPEWLAATIAAATNTT